MTPRLVVHDVARQVEFLKRAFHAKGEYRTDVPSEISIGDSRVMVSSVGPRDAMPAFLYLYVDDIDATYRRALEAGAVSLEDPQDLPYGDRRGMITDPCGNLWQIATRTKDASLDSIRQRTTAAPEKGGTERPIGYWLKRADEAITAHVKEALAGLGLTRFHWQALSIIHGSGATTVKHLLEEMQGFVDAAELEKIFDSLEARGWLRRVSDSSGAALLELTEAGTKAHADALEVQSRVRRQTMQGVAEDDYVTVIRVLKTIVSNSETPPRSG